MLMIATVAIADWDAGVKAFQAKNYAEAITQFKAVVEGQPDVFQGHMMLGQAYFKAGKNAEAAASLKRALELNPNDGGTKVTLANALLKSGKYADCIQLLSNTGSLDAKLQGPATQIKAQCNSKGGGDATADLKKLAQLKPNDADAQYAYGVAELNGQNINEAVTALTKAVTLDGSERNRQSLIQALVRQARTTRGDKTAIYKKAVSQAQAVVAANGSYDNVLRLGEMQMGAKMYDQAIGSFKKAGGMNSTDYLPNYYLGQSLGSAGRWVEAEPPLKTALNQAKAADKANVYKYLGFVYEKQKNFPAAIDAYTRGGDSGAATRAQENQRIAEENADADKHNAEIARIKAEQERIQKELEALPGSGPPR
jgi:tetratricopeptide (TPR) repeat protein